MDIAPREKFGLGSSLKKFVRKVIPNEVADVAVKAAPFVAPFNPLLAAGMAGIGGFDQTGSISKSLRSGALTYGLGNLARVVGGAGPQFGLKAQGAGTGFGSYFTSPMSGQQLFGAPKVTPDIATTEPLGIEEMLYETDPSKLTLGQQADIVAQQVSQTPTKTGYKDLLGRIVGKDATLGQRTQAIKELGGKAIKDIYTTDKGKVDKLAIAATVSGVGSYLEAKKLAEEAGLVDDADEYTEAMYEADKAKYADKYAEYLTPEAFGLKEGGRVKLQDGTVPSITLQKNENGIMTLPSIESDPDSVNDDIERIAQLVAQSDNMDREAYMNNKQLAYDRIEKIAEDISYGGNIDGVRSNLIDYFNTKVEDYTNMMKPQKAEGGRMGYKVGTTPVYLEDSLFKDKDYISSMEESDKVKGIMEMLLKEKRVPTEKEYKKGTESYKSSQDDLDKFIEKYKNKTDSYDLNKSDSKDRFPMEVIVLEKMLKDKDDELNKMDTDVGEMINKMVRTNRKFGSPKDGEEGVMSLNIESKDGNKEIDMMMADAPGITFTSGEKSFLFKTLAGQGGSDRSFTMPQLYGVLNNPNSSKNIEDAKALKAFLKMKGFKKGGRVQYAMGSPEENAKEASGISGIPLNVNPAGATELDMRETGGFIPPVGVKEKADDIPAMLSNNEFVFTADAVRAAGGGSVNKGAKKMYDLMKSLEGKVV